MPGMNDIYQITDQDSHIVLSVVIGFAGKSTSYIKLNGSPQNGIIENSFTYDLGPAKDNAGKELTILTMVLKTIDGNNNSSFTVSIRQVEKEITYPTLKDDSPANPVDYKATINFIT